MDNHKVLLDANGINLYLNNIYSLLYNLFFYKILFCLVNKDKRGSQFVSVPKVIIFGNIIKMLNFKKSWTLNIQF